MTQCVGAELCADSTNRVLTLPLRRPAEHQEKHVVTILGAGAGAARIASARDGGLNLGEAAGRRRPSRAGLRPAGD